MFLSSERDRQPGSCLHPGGSGGLNGRLSSSLRSAVTLGLFLSLSFSSCSSAVFSLLFGADAAAMWQEGERPHIQTHTHSLTQRFSRSAIESKTQKLLAAYHFFSLPFFFFGWCGYRGCGRELRRSEPSGEGGETPAIGKWPCWLHSMGHPLFFFSLDCMFREMEIEVGKLRCMLETCAAAAAPPCSADDIRSGGAREATGTHTKVSFLVGFLERKYQSLRRHLTIEPKVSLLSLNAELFFSHMSLQHARTL